MLLQNLASCFTLPVQVQDGPPLAKEEICALNVNFHTIVVSSTQRSLT